MHTIKETSKTTRTKTTQSSKRCHWFSAPFVSLNSWHRKHLLKYITKTQKIKICRHFFEFWNPSHECVYYKNFYLEKWLTQLENDSVYRLLECHISWLWYRIRPFDKCNRVKFKVAHLVHCWPHGRLKVRCTNLLWLFHLLYLVPDVKENFFCKN